MASRALTGAAILALDDDPRFLRLLQSCLRFGGHIVSTAQNNQDALQLLEQRQPDLVILDLNLPAADGETFFLDARESGYDGPFLVISGDLRVRLRSARLGVPYIQKPFDPGELLELIGELIGENARRT